MLVLGRAANNYYMGINNDESPNEYLCWNKEEQNTLIKELKLKDEDICFRNEVSTVYERNGSKFTIHDAEVLPVFKSIGRYIPIIDGKYEMAPLLVVAAWAKAIALFRQEDINNWHNFANTYSYLYPTIEKLDSKWRKRLRVWTSHLTFIGALSYNHDFMPYKYKDYNYFTEDSLFKLYKSDGFYSYWKKLTGGSSDKKSPNYTMFSKMSHQDRIDAVLERIYVDCTNEYLLEEILEGKSSEEATIDLFKKSIMNRCSQPNFPWLAEFIVENYKEIMEEFDPYFTDNLMDAIQYKMLKEVK